MCHNFFVYHQKNVTFFYSANIALLSLKKYIHLHDIKSLKYRFTYLHAENINLIQIIVEKRNVF